jgi:SAM-dependent methyltransferase
MANSYISRARARIHAHGVGRTIRHLFTAVLPKIYIDLRYGGRYCFDIPGLNKSSGQHDLIHSNLADLQFVFSHIDIRKTDVLVDIGCGAGRVLNYWLSLGLPNKLIGIEYNDEVARAAAQTYRKRKNVEILSGDAAELAPRCGGTLFYFFNPFMPEGVRRFEAGMRGKPIRILYYYPRYLEAFENPAWRIEHVPQGDAGYPLAIIVPAV